MIENDYTENDYYVSFDAVFRVIDEYDDYVIDDETGEWYIPISKALSLIENIPPADVRPVVRGKWVHGREVGREYLGDCLVGIFYDRWTCSECGYIVDDHAYSRINYNFCPHCGADMRGK